MEGNWVVTRLFRCRHLTGRLSTCQQYQAVPIPEQRIIVNMIAPELTPRLDLAASRCLLGARNLQNDGMGENGIESNLMDHRHKRRGHAVACRRRRKWTGLRENSITTYDIPMYDQPASFCRVGGSPDDIYETKVSHFGLTNMIRLYISLLVVNSKPLGIV